MRKKWTKEGALSCVHSEKAKKGSVMERGKKDRISSQESKTAEPEFNSSNEQGCQDSAIARENETKVIDLEHNFHRHTTNLVGIYLMKESEISVTSEKRTENKMSETERWHFD